jgi:uncharacterized protein with HEPN domain
MTGRDAACVWDMLNAAQKILDFTRGHTLDTFCADQKLQMAVERAIEIIGEAARRLSSEFRDTHQEIPWRAIIAQRNVLIHEYDGVNPERVWRAVSAEMPRLIEQLRPLVPPVPENEEECPSS